MNALPDREEALFRAAVELQSGPARAAFLDQACAGNPTLRARLVALLAAHEQTEGVLGDSAPAAAKVTMKIEFADEPADEAVGQTLGRYKLLERVGEGGCGVVYVAEQTEPVRRRVALKVIKLGMDTKQVVARFEAERQALAMMDHPNIAKVLDAGTTDVGRPYFVMELVRGIKITDYCDQANLSTKERLDLFIKVCQAIQHAHQKGIIHRDIKPSNILVTLHDGVPVPKVIDFGIAKATEGRLTDNTVYTQLHQFIGTPAYMSPEQAEMSGLDIDTRSDIYSLGVLLYELLAGSTPFDAKELMASGLDAMRKTIREQEPMRPSTRVATLGADQLTSTAKRRSSDTSKLLRQLKGDLDWIVMKCLEKDRARRYETANGLAADLKRHLGNEPVTARPPGQLYRLQKAYRRNRLAFTAAACVLVAMVIAMIFIWVAGQREGLARVRESIQRNLAEQRRMEAEANEKRAVAAQASEVKQRQAADEQRQQAQSQELMARQQAFAADMNLAQQALAMNNLGRAQMLLNRHKPRSGQQDLRGWEWRYLWGQGRSDAVFNFTENKTRAGSLAVSPDGQRIATGTTLSLFDWRTKRRLTPDPAEIAGAYVAFSPQAPVLAFPMQSNGQFSVRLWNVATREVVGSLPLGGPAGRLAFSADGKTLATATEPPDSRITLWRVPEGTPIKRHSIGDVTSHGAQSPLAFARDMRVVAYAADDRWNVIQVIDLATGQTRWTAACDMPVQALAFSHDGKILASGEFGNEGTMRLWDVATGQSIGRPIEGHRAWVSELVFWPDGKMLASASADQTIRLWDLTDPANVRPIRTLQGHKYEVWSLALMPDQRHLLSGSKDGELLVWDTAAARSEKGLVRLPEKLWTWSFAPDSKSVLIVDQQGRVLRRMGDSFRVTETLIEAGTNISSALISQDGRLAATGTTNGVVQVWDLQKRTLLSTVPLSTGEVVPIGLLPKTKSLFVYRADDSSIREWDLAGMTETRSWLDVPRDPRGPPTLSTTENDQWRLLIQYGGWGRLRNMASGEEWPLTPGIDWSSSSALSPNGKLMADASRSGFVTLWNRDGGTMRRQHTFARFMLGAHSVAFSTDGQRLAAGSGSGHEAIRLWDVQSKQELLTLASSDVVFAKTDFSPNGNILGSMDGPGYLHLWLAPSWEEIAAVEAREKAEGPQR